MISKPHAARLRTRIGRASELLKRFGKFGERDVVEAIARLRAIGMQLFDIAEVAGRGGDGGVATWFGRCGLCRCCGCRCCRRCCRNSASSPRPSARRLELSIFKRIRFQWTGQQFAREVEIARRTA